MHVDAVADDLERRKRVRLRLRPDLRVERHAAADGGGCVLKDPVSLRYYRFDAHESFLLRLLDGKHTLDEARQAFEREFRPKRLTLEDLEGFGQLLLKAGLVYSDAPQAGRQSFERRTKRRRREILQAVTNVLYIPIPLFDPDPLLGAMLCWGRWLFRPAALLAGVGLMLAALLLVGTHWAAFRAQLPAQQEFFSFKNMATLWVALGLAKVLHEFGHGLACKACGGEVHDMGALLLCLSPCLYLNVSDAWTLPDKKQRMLVGLAGIYVELLVAAVATFVWWNTSTQPTLRHLCLGLMVVCSVNTLLFNGNPLLRFDGYYVLADWLEVPNLRDRCNQFLKRVVMEHGLGMEVPPEPPMPPGRKVLFVTYAVASYVYGWVVTFGVLWFLSGFLKPYKLGSVSLLLALAAAASLAGWPLFRLAQGLHRRGKLPPMQPGKATFSAGGLAVLVLAFFLVPLPVSRIREQALVQPRPDAVEPVFVALPGTLEKLHVRDGQAVAQGDLLAEFRDLELEGQLEEARSQHAIRAVQVKALRQQAAETGDAQERARLETALAQADGERKVFARQVELREKALNLLAVRAPRDGVVLGAPRREEVGKRWDKGQEEPLCSLGDPRRLRALVPLTPADYRLLKEDLAARPGLGVTLRVDGWGAKTWPGRVAALPESEAKEVPLALTTRAGGPLEVKPGTRPHTHVPQSQYYLVGVNLLDAENDAVWPGTLGQVKIHCRWRPAAWWVWRTISLTFDLGLV